MDAHRIADEAVTKWGALQKPAELAGLLEILDTVQPKIIIEIGSDAGGTLWAWSQLPGPPEVIAIDLPGGPYRATPGDTRTHGATLIEGASKDPAVIRRVHHLLARYDPQGAARRSPRHRHVNRSADMLIIDGDHRYEGVMHDWAAYHLLVREGGLVVFHDVCEHGGADVGVRRAWKEISPAWPHTEIVTPPLNWGGIGVLRLSPPDPEPPLRITR